MSVVNSVVRMLPDSHEIFPSLDTPYSKYCGTNYAAWGRDIPAIHKILSDQQQQIDDLDAIIKSMENLLGQLRKKQDHIRYLKKAHEGFISSGVRRLPSEILREIFKLCLPWVMYPEPNTKEAPLLLTRICQRWREIALDTPELWCSVSIGLNNKVMEPEQSLSFYHHWLSSTKNCPLSLDVDVRTPKRISAVAAFSRPYFVRCPELSINFDEAIALDLLLAEVPMLRSLMLVGDMDTIRNAKPVSISQPQPRLRGLIIEAPSFGSDILSLFNPGWTNLTHLSVTLDIDWTDVSDLDRDIFSAFLLACTNLEHLTFSPVCLTHPNPVSITHTKLRTLEIAKLYRHGSIRMAMLTFPSLCNLRVLLDAESGTVPFSAVDISEDDEDVLMGTDRNPQMTVARQRTCHVSIEPVLMTGQLLTFLDLGWSSLRCLNMNIVDTSSTFLTLLQRCPNLEDISIHVLAFFDHGVLPSLPFIHHRLRSLSVSSNTPTDEEILDLVTLPNLRHLSLAFLNRACWPHKRFKNFLSRSCCPVEALDIKGVQDFQEGDWMEFTTLMPTLQKLELEAKSWSYSWSS